MENPLKKENLGWEPFSDNVEWSSKKLQNMISADTKTDAKQKTTGSCILFHRSDLLKTWNTM